MGSSGLSIDRDVFLHEDAMNLVRALNAVAHENKGADELVAIVGE